MFPAPVQLKVYKIESLRGVMFVSAPDIGAAHRWARKQLGDGVSFKVSESTPEEYAEWMNSQ